MLISEKLKVTQTRERNFHLFVTKIDSDTLNGSIKEDEGKDELQERIIAFGSEDNLWRLAESHIWFLGDLKLVHDFSISDIVPIKDSKK